MIFSNVLVALRSRTRPLNMNLIKSQSFYDYIIHSIIHIVHSMKIFKHKKIIKP